MLRAVRFAAQLGFEIEPGTREAIRRGRRALERISRERIAEELTRILVSPRPALGLRLATDLGLMAHAIPEVLPMRGVSQRPLHHKDVFEHTMGVVENIPADRPCAGRRCCTTSASPAPSPCTKGRCTSSGTRTWASAWPAHILRRLHFDTRLVERVATLVRMHLRVNSYESEWTDSAVRRLMREAGDELAEPDPPLPGGRHQLPPGAGAGGHHAGGRVRAPLPGAAGSRRTSPGCTARWTGTT